MVEESRNQLERRGDEVRGKTPRFSESGCRFGFKAPALLPRASSIPVINWVGTGGELHSGSLLPCLAPGPARCSKNNKLNKLKITNNTRHNKQSSVAAGIQRLTMWGDRPKKKKSGEKTASNPAKPAKTNPNPATKTRQTAQLMSLRGLFMH